MVVDNQGKAFEIKSPCYIKKHDKRIDELKSKRDYCKKQSTYTEVTHNNEVKKIWKPSRRWTKYQKTLEKALRKRREQTKTFMYTLANALCSQYDCIGIGDYTPGKVQKYKSMNRSMINQSLIGRFKECLNWVCAKSGKHFIEYDERNTTRRCHSCRTILCEGLSPEIRSWTCENCHTHYLRDENAAINGLLRVEKELLNKNKTVPGSGLVSVMERCAWQVLPRGLCINLGGKTAN